MRTHEQRLAALVTLAAAALLLAHAARELPFFADDGFISLRYAQRLLEGRGLTWTDGEAVEGYSNLLWVLGCAGLGALGLDLVTAARLAHDARVRSSASISKRRSPTSPNTLLAPASSRRQFVRR